MLVVIIVMLFMILMFKSNAEGATIPDDVGVQCIMGEARGEGYDGLLAHAYALRNRGRTQGVYGCGAKFKEPNWVWNRARRAWNYSKDYPENDTTRGATHWGSTIVDKKWIRRMELNGFILTATVMNTKFYKESR